MNASDYPPDYYQYRPPQLPSIGGTAMVGGVHLSTRTIGTGSNLHLFLTGVALMAMGAGAAILTYIAVWVIGRVTAVPVVELLLGVVTPAEVLDYGVWQIGINLLTFLSFLVVVRLSPLAGYHAAEHKVVHAIEEYGYATAELARQMPRAHDRCGTTLLAGILPTFFIAAPLFFITPGLALLVVLVGWVVRYRIGYAIQQIFTTKEPTDAQLQAGLEAGYELLAKWRTQPPETLSLVQSLWRRGFIQLITGAIVGTNILGWVYRHLHIWLDWTQ